VEGHDQNLFGCPSPHFQIFSGAAAHNSSLITKQLNYCWLLSERRKCTQAVINKHRVKIELSRRQWQLANSRLNRSDICYYRAIRKVATSKLSVNRIKRLKAVNKDIFFLSSNLTVEQKHSNTRSWYLNILSLTSYATSYIAAVLEAAMCEKILVRFID